MLEIKTGFKKGDAVTILLESLTEIVGRFVSEDDNSITLSSVRMVVPQATQNGGISVAMQPLSFSAKDGHSAEMTFQRKSFLMAEKSLDQIDSQLRQEDTGISLSGK